MEAAIGSITAGLQQVTISQSSQSPNVWEESYELSLQLAFKIVSQEVSATRSEPHFENLKKI